MYDTIIIGGGPAAIASGIYAARKKIKTLLITESFGGQSIVSDNIENWIGEVSISGIELAQKMEKHLRSFNSIEIKTPDMVDAVTSNGHGDFVIHTKSGDTYEAHTVIVASGGRRRRLGIPGEDKYDGKGVAFCSTCDAPLFSDKDVVVVGGGNSALESAIDLLAYAKKIYLVVRGDKLRGDQVSQEKIKNNPKIEIIFNADSKEIIGEQFVTGFKYMDKNSEKEKSLDVSGVFVEIGSIPNSEMVKSLVHINDFGEIVVDHKTGAASLPGIFAAGDVCDDLYKQNNISVGDGVRAALSAYNYILNRQKQTPAAG